MGGLLLLLAAAPAAAATPCWRSLLTDSYDGRVDKLYPLPCYHQAISHLPESSRIYSNLEDEILNAEQLAAKHEIAPSSRSPRAVASKSSGLSSLPLPLLVLGGLAILLLAAGGVGMAWQRAHGRDFDAG